MGLGGWNLRLEEGWKMEGMRVGKGELIVLKRIILGDLVILEKHAR